MRRIFAVAAAFCMIWLSSCGGGKATLPADQEAFYAGINMYNALSYAGAAAAFESFTVTYPNSSLIPKAYYYLGKSLYHLNDPAGAITKFDIVLSRYPTSAYADNSLLWKGKSIQKQANIQFATGNLIGLAVATQLFMDARAAYLQVTISYPNTLLRPDCDYQIGLTYYDEQSYSMARTLLQAVVASYPASTAADGAQYYYARSIHALALVATPNNTLALARTEYAKLMTNYPLSIFVDNAQYQIGKTYYDELNYAAAIVEFGKVLAIYAALSSADDAQYYKARSMHALALTVAPPYTFQQVRDEYAKLIANYPASILVDNAAFHSALTYHDSTQCVSELSALQAFVSAYPASTYVATATIHISDLLLVPHATHTVCI